MKQLVIVCSGKKQSGKNSNCNYIIAKYLNYINRWGDTKVQCCPDCPVEDGPHLQSFYVNAKGELRQHSNENTMFDLERYGIKLYSFADPLKRFCIDVLGALEEQCYGTDAQKNTIIPHLLWENLPKEVRPYTVKHHLDYADKSNELSSQIRHWDEDVYKTGPMTGRELMQIFGTTVVRHFYEDAWARGTYNSVKREGYNLSLISDARFPNEINLGNMVEAKTIRLLRSISTDNHESETALDNFPLEKYTLVMDNRAMSLKQQCDFVDPFVNKWFSEAGLI